MEQESQEMIIFQKQLRETIDGWIKSSLTEIFIKREDYIGEKRNKVYQLIKESLPSNEQKIALEYIIKDIMVSVLFSFFDMIDEGIDLPDNNLLLLDIINRETGKSIISYSAHEEFINLMPDGYEPFEENE